MPKKILAVYETMGMGHERMANIIRDILSDPDVEFIKAPGSELIGSSNLDSVVKLWNFFIRKNMIRTVDILINFVARILDYPAEEVIQTGKLHDKLDEIGPDIIICTADVYNKPLGTYAAEKGIPLYVVITEISVFSDLVTPDATHICYFNETTDVIHSFDFSLAGFSQAIDRSTSFGKKLQYVMRYYRDYILLCFKNSIYKGISHELEAKNNARVEVIGPLAESKHYLKKDRAELRKMIGIPGDSPAVLIASGSIGGKFLEDMTRLIADNYNGKLTLLVICGHDNATFQKIKSLDLPNKAIRILPYEYVNNFDEFLEASDCIIMRPSAGIFIESLLHRIPSVALYPVTSNDMGSVEMIQKYHIGELCKRKKDVIPALSKVIDRNPEYRTNIEGLMSVYPSSYEAIKEKVNRLILASNEAVDDEVAATNT